MKDTDEYKAMFERHLKDHQQDNETRRLVLQPNPDPKRHLQPSAEQKRIIAGGEVLTPEQLEKAAHASAEREYRRTFSPAPDWIGPDADRPLQAAADRPAEKPKRRWEFPARSRKEPGGKER